ncbi:MAG: amino acid decarboxylase [Gemmatimonadetes bacterium]|uniref:Amino acid decarboxylase n=1 Tax=Candidatus Kutchimonas denitrificans TaxID=3056748 RepID=A0AAE5CCM1_9BACT|nr:amino acid decarboxylase [Gemmatimonadota bacterium]NIR75840.1 amino acid decarboxylase [Candidatus Kutchimonas denitrificans]NIS02007.1 amino acid decarboxylase [Gemmatimonadota bacterium]NIT67811.1 amino acid decarboxylase [Gemmatimonadota bacterium]NIU53798.1 amino acid decarboxylase [Gemmatimonadota bacterium]
MHTIDAPDPTASPDDTGLDPARWDRLQALGHRMLDDMFEQLQTLRERPVWRPVPEEVARRLSVPLPRRGIGAEAAYEAYLRDVFPYPLGNTHPRFWGWVLGSGTPVGVLSELLAAAMNPNLSGLRSGAIHVERQVLAWLKEMLGYPATSSGLLLSGGSMANLVGLAVGATARAEFDVAAEGWAAAPRRPVVYASAETHFSVEKAVRTLGLGTDRLRYIPTDAEYRIDLAALDAAIEADRRAGLHPLALVGNAGTVNTGAFDDLERLADVAEREGLWFHVDAAFGAFAALDPELADRVRGLERADSLAFDLHKWLLVPVEAGAILVRHPEAQRAAFRVSGEYVSHVAGGIGKDSTEFAELGPQLTRGFRALKVWMSLKAHGADAYAALVRRNVEQARYLARRVTEHPQLELLAPVPLNVVNYRFDPGDLDGGGLDELNHDILVRLHEDGIAAPSHTRLGGRFALRVCITNHRTRRNDLDLLLRETVRLGADLLEGGEPASFS